MSRGNEAPPLRGRPLRGRQSTRVSVILGLQAADGAELNVSFKAGDLALEF